jgi:uncharacterized membrane protein
MVTTMGVTVFMQSLSRSAAAAIELLGNAIVGIVVSDRFSGYKRLPPGAAQAVLGACAPRSHRHR